MAMLTLPQKSWIQAPAHADTTRKFTLTQKIKYKI